MYTYRWLPITHYIILASYLLKNVLAKKKKLENGISRQEMLLYILVEITRMCTDMHNSTYGNTIYMLYTNLFLREKATEMEMEMEMDECFINTILYVTILHKS